MGYTYIFRFEDGSGRWKLGKATTLSSRKTSLRVGNKELQLFDYVETENPLRGEQFLKHLWRARLYQYRSEIYRLTEDEVRSGMAELRRYLDNELPTVLAEEAQVSELEPVDNTDTLIDATDEMTAAHRRLVAIEAEVRRLQAEAEPLRRTIMLGIGKNRGIAGVATFDKADSNRAFNAEKFEADHPELVQQFQKSVLDSTALRKQFPDLYDEYKEASKKRTFFLIEDLGT